MEKPGENPKSDFLKRFKTIRELGSGSFGKVFEVKWKLDRCVNRTYAMKVIEPSYVEDEVQACRKIAKLDPQDESCCIKIRWAFIQDNLRTHLIFPKFGENLDSFQFNSGTFSLNDIRHISYQILKALKFIHENSIIHCDMKGNNVVIVDSGYIMIGKDKYLMRTDVKLIDFGISVDTTRHPDYYERRPTVQNRCWRAPEVTLALGYSYPIDIWGAACIFFAMYTELDLLDHLPTITKNCHLGALEKVFGKFSMSVINKIPEQTKNRYFDAVGTLKVTDTDRKHILAYKEIKEYAKDNNVDSKLFLDLLKQMFKLDQNARVTAEAALNHPFFLPLRKRS